MMNKSDLISVVSEKGDLSNTKSAKMVDTLLNIIVSKLSQGEKVQLPGFGTFEVKSKAERTGRNPQTGEEIKIPAAKVPSFTPGKVLKSVVNQKSLIDEFLKEKKINEKEAEFLTYIIEKIKEDKEIFLQVEYKDIAKDLGMAYEDVEKVGKRLIQKSILDTMVYYGDTDSVYLRSNWRKYL